MIFDLPRYEARARVARALGHPTRLFLLDVLGAQERCVCELTDMVGADQSTVSKHLAVLRSAGLVTGRRRGATTYYRIACPCLAPLLESLGGVLRANLQAQRHAIGR
jgi:ArsR family transcriptional regulator